MRRPFKDQLSKHAAEQTGGEEQSGGSLHTGDRNTQETNRGTYEKTGIIDQWRIDLKSKHCMKETASSSPTEFLVLINTF